jgi:hypothetical protein
VEISFSSSCARHPADWQQLRDRYRGSFTLQCEHSSTGVLRLTTASSLVDKFDAEIEIAGALAALCVFFRRRAELIKSA